MSSRTPRNPNQSGGIASWLPWAAAIVVIAVIAVVAVVSAKGNRTDGEKAWEKDAVIEVDGENLPPVPDGGADDPAAGTEAPGITGRSVLDGDDMSIEDNGRGKVIAVIAHWCPTCQAEVPKIVEHVEANPVRDDVDFVGLTTSLTPQRGNYPPSDWLRDESWDVPTIVDDADGTAGAALGINAFPTFIVLDADNQVVARTSGAIDMSVLDTMFDLAAGDA